MYAGKCIFLITLHTLKKSEFKLEVNMIKDFEWKNENMNSI